MRFLLLLLCVLVTVLLQGQGLSEEEAFISRLKAVDTPPDGLLSSRSVVLFSNDYSQKELEEIQKGFQRIGIDAVSYIESERTLAGRDLMNSYGRYFAIREIRFLIFLRKSQDGFDIHSVLFNAKSWIEPEQSSWHTHASSLNGLLQSVFRALISTQKRQNFLVNDFPERSGPTTLLGSRREEDCAPGIRVFKLAVPKTGDPESDKKLDQFIKETLRAKYEMVEADASEKDLGERGFVYVLRFIHARGSLAKDILGYDMSKSESALATVSYPNGTLQLKTIASNHHIYKFYIKNIEEQIYYLGRKWDADITWEESLKNYVDGYLAAGKLN